MASDDPAHPHADLLAALTRERYLPLQSPPPEEDVEEVRARRRETLNQALPYNETELDTPTADVIPLHIRRAS